MVRVLSNVNLVLPASAIRAQRGSRGLLTRARRSAGIPGWQRGLGWRCHYRATADLQQSPGLARGDVSDPSHLLL